MNIWFTSDQHFDHENIIKLANRPFSGVTEMNEAIITAHNDIVKPGDSVYHLGDFCFTWGDSVRPSKLLKLLNGQHFLIKGNHDRVRNWDPFPKFIWVRERDKLKTKTYGDIYMDHYPLRDWPGRYRGRIQVYGHTHGTLEPLIGSAEVGVDIAYRTLNEWRPFSIEEIREMARYEEYLEWIETQTIKPKITL